MFERFSGLPVHVLVVHAVVILVPMSAVAVLALAVRPRWRHTYGPLVALVTTGALASVPVATRSGTWLRDQLGYPADGFRHGELGDRVLWLVAPFWLLTLALLVLDRRMSADRPSGGASRGFGNREGRRGSSRARQPWPVIVVAVLAVVTGLAATAQVIRTGDSGAESVWGGRIP